MPNNRRRGAAGERELCHLLSEALGFNVSRRLGQARDSGHDIDLPGFAVEVKKRRKVGVIYDAMEQADKGSKTPVVAIRADSKYWLVAMKLEDWIKLAREEVVAHLADEATNGR